MEATQGDTKYQGKSPMKGIKVAVEGFITRLIRLSTIAASLEHKNKQMVTVKAIVFFYTFILYIK